MTTMIHQFWAASGPKVHPGYDRKIDRAGSGFSISFLLFAALQKVETTFIFQVKFHSFIGSHFKDSRYFEFDFNIPQGEGVCLILN